MNRIRRLCQLLLLSGASTLTGCVLHRGHASPAPTLRVMTFNIQAGAGSLSGIADAIAAAHADVVALQEVDVHWDTRSAFADQAGELAARLGMQVRFAPIYSLPGRAGSAVRREYGVALLSRLPIVAFTNHAITRHSTLADSAAPALMPGFLECVVTVHGRRVRLFNTHLDYRGNPSVRRQQIAESLKILDADSTPLLFFGDLNAAPTAPELQPLFARLTDAWSDSLGSGFTYPASAPVRRIDYVLASRHFRVAAAHVPATQASDHRPVVVDVVLAPER
jgi:endonuclease/exonuclease/phosphatase family metal-dependent hydrolase